MSLNMDVVDLKNNVVEQLELKENVFDVKVKPHLLHRSVVGYLKNRRQGTASTKNRSEVRGGGTKPWKQKGTGRARMGSIRSPLKRGGGVAFGPTPRDYSYKIPKKERHEALISSLSLKVKEGDFLIIDKIELDQPKTKHFLSFIDQLGISGNTLFVVTGDNKNLEVASRNIQWVGVTYPDSLNVYNMLYYKKIVCTKEAVLELNKK